MHALDLSERIEDPGIVRAACRLLRRGRPAVLVVLETNLFDADQREIARTRVRLTMRGGVIDQHDGVQAGNGRAAASPLRYK